jgi:hypothetical protein
MRFVSLVVQPPIASSLDEISDAVAVNVDEPSILGKSPQPISELVGDPQGFEEPRTGTVVDPEIQGG